MRSLCLIGCLCWMLPAARAELAIGLSPIGALDGSNPVASFTSYPADTLAAGGAVEFGYLLADQIAETLLVEIVIRDEAGVETVLFEGLQATGPHSFAADLAEGRWSIELRALDGFGNQGLEHGDPFEILHGTVDAKDALPRTFALERVAPNPFNPTTTLSFVLPETGDVDLRIYNMRGQRVATLIDGRMAAGRHGVLFDAGDLPSGLYFAKLSTQHGSATAKLTLLK